MANMKEAVVNIGNLGQLASTLQNSDDKQVLINHCADEIKFTSKTDRNKSTYVFFLWMNFESS